jgi:protein-disulfide isomerase
LILVNTGNINVSGKQARGNPNASISIIEFGEFLCESCNISRIVTDALIGTGKIKVYFKHYPLDSSCNSETNQARDGSCRSSLAAECAAKQEKFWEYYDLLFDNQNFSEWSLKNHAERIGLNMSDFNQCLNNNETMSIVLQDIKEGFSAGVIGTPMFYINGKVVIGLQPLSVFMDIIESLN